MSIATRSWRARRDGYALPNTPLYSCLVEHARLKARVVPLKVDETSLLKLVWEFQQEFLSNMGDGQLSNVACPAAQLHDALPAQFLQRWLPFPAGSSQALLGATDVVLQEGKERREGALVARK